MKVQHFASYALGLTLVLGVASLFNLSWTGLFPVLLLLGCPLMMLVMMRGMDHDDSGERGKRADAADRAHESSHAPWAGRKDPRPQDDRRER